ncbi:cytochrome c maturation protein CcmE [Prosthecodimorpha staleyi]|uniref:Cytochrome c-type biogenesis protein CcmE n=1 Tax=Prosthecodimorpha staleyi TaxID=2840188 RepID=A0A947GCE4_9HYPH|nr:cytochrome c maturation protein CcmE [Prosthecodimorpha staleyi]MBT9289101.1 cytochrome c maturation protein CcmE [Prosthecodimorpha staleyi]
MTRKQRRLTMIGTAGAVLALAAGLIFWALSDSVAFFNSPSDVMAKRLPPEQRIRLGGLVKEGSVVRGEGTTVRFEITDKAVSIPVTYTGILPDLFREGQGVVAEGRMTGEGSFRADHVLAKHDENYMPKEVADSLKAQGHWQGDKGADAPK